MEFSSVLDRQFSRVMSLRGTVCKERYARKVDGSVFSKWCDGAEESLFCAYRLAGCSTLSGEEVRAGFFVMRQSVVAYGYEAGGEFNVQLVKHPLKMDDLERVLGLLVNEMVRGGIVSDVMYRLKKLPEREAVITSFSDVVCKETGNKVFKLDGVVVNFGFDTMPFSMFFGCPGGVWAACLADSFSKTLYTSEYETVFVSAEEGNDFFQGLKKCAARRENGEVIYRLDGEEFFKRFYRVCGVSLEAGGCR